MGQQWVRLECLQAENLAYCGKETQTLYSYSEDGESNGATLIGDKESQAFDIKPPDGLTIRLNRPLRTLLDYGLSRQEICDELGISDKTLSNAISGQPVGYAVMERYTQLFQTFLRERGLFSVEDFIHSIMQANSATDDLKLLIDQGWSVPKLAHTLGKSSRQVYRWLEGAKCKEAIRRKIVVLSA